MSPLHRLYKQSFRVRMVDEGLYNCKRLSEWCISLSTPNAHRKYVECQETIKKLQRRRMRLVYRLLKIADGNGIKPLDIWSAIDQHFERFQSQRPQ